MDEICEKCGHNIVDCKCEQKIASPAFPMYNRKDIVSKLNYENSLIQNLTVAQKQTKFVTILAVILLILVISFFIYRDKTNEIRLIKTINGFTTMEKEFKYDDLGWQGQKEVFRKHMMKLYTIYSYAYDRKEKKALSDKEKAEYINLCFDLAKDLGHPLSRWHGPIISIMESSMNPYALGDFITIKDKEGKKREVPTSYGMCQMKLSAAMHYYGYYLLLPKWFKNRYPIKITSEEDLLSWRTSTILLYSGLWGLYNKEFMGEHHWVVSAHHFGSTVLSRFFNGGNGKLPSYFIYNGVKFPVSEYWTCFLGMKEAFETGKLEVGRPFERKWHKVKKIIQKEEKEFIRNYNTFKYFKKEIYELKQDKKNYLERIENLEKDINDTHYKLVKKLGDIKTGRFKTIKQKFDESKGIIKEWVKKYYKNRDRNTIIQWIIAGLITLVILFLIFYFIILGIISSIKKIKRRFLSGKRKE